YLSTLLTFGIPGFLLSWYLLKYKITSFSTLEYAFLTGAAAGLILFFYSLFSAYSDGRFIWYTYPFAVPLAVSFLSKEIKRGNFIFLKQILKFDS
ncbi:MAG TPA: hypothetical protein VMT35_17815, partial [Ignavibacteriaceae bacterium]|nr:hypothetical protein [Ignavibacteriaceae bacterium]